MRIDGAIAGVWRRFNRWVRTGEASPEAAPKVDSRPVAANESFLSTLDEAQRLAVLSAIFAAGRPISRSAPLE